MSDFSDLTEGRGLHDHSSTAESLFGSKKHYGVDRFVLQDASTQLLVFGGIGAKRYTTQQLIMVDAVTTNYITKANNILSTISGWINIAGAPAHIATEDGALYVHGDGIKKDALNNMEWAANLAVEATFRNVDLAGGNMIQSRALNVWKPLAADHTGDTLGQLTSLLALATEFTFYIQHKTAIDRQIALHPTWTDSLHQIEVIVDGTAAGFNQAYIVSDSPGATNAATDKNDHIITANAGDWVEAKAGDDDIKTYDGDDYINGGTGADTMTGGRGNDTYAVDSTADLIVELNNQGRDMVHASITYVLPASNIEDVTLIGTDNIDAGGNSFSNVLIGNSGDNRLFGAAGNDSLNGGLGDDYLDGGVGINVLTGGQGNDTFAIGNAGDQIVEYAGEGTDLLITPFTTSLVGTEIEGIKLIGTSNRNATGNDYDNSLTGNSGVNILDGGAGADSMAGGAGSDLYYVDNLGDVVIEYSNQGTDTVYATVSVDMSSQYVENITLKGIDNIDATGNALANVIIGNDGNNHLAGGAGADKLTANQGNDWLDGGSGADTLAGGKGDDTYVVDNVGDTVIESAAGGNDTVLSWMSYSIVGVYVENISLLGTGAHDATGNNFANHLTGNAGANKIDGGGGADVLDGGAGKDILTGGSGADTFVFGPGSGLDLVQDFNVNEGDWMNVHAYSGGVIGAVVTITQVGSSAVLDFGGGNKAVVLHTVATDPGFLSHIIW